MKIKSKELVAIAFIGIILQGCSSTNITAGLSPSHAGPSRMQGISEENLSINRPWLPKLTPANQISATQRSDMDKLANVFLPSLVRSHGGLNPHEMELLSEEYKRFNIVGSNGKVSGSPIGDLNTKAVIAGGIPVVEYVQFMQKVENTFSRAKDDTDQLELKQMFIDMTVNLVGQGWEDSNYATTGVNFYGTASWPAIFLKMRDVLAEAKLLKDVTRILITTQGGEPNIFALRPAADTDLMAKLYASVFPLSLALPDEAERLQHLQALQRTFNSILTDDGMLAEDGSGYHHGGFHYAYASYEIPVAIDIFAALADTGFRLSPQAHQRLKNFVYSMAFASDKFEMPPNVQMRAGTTLSTNMTGLAAKMANVGTPDRKLSIDPDMAALHLFLTDKPDNPDAQLYIKQGIVAKALTGHYTLNGGVGAFQRRDNWLVSIFGMVNYWRGLEIYGWQQSNNYARYAKNGSIWVQSSGNPVSATASGLAVDGWNWSHWPGTTALERPSSELFQGYGFGGNKSNFGGGTDLNGNGIWGMDLTGNDVNFKKSAFSFDNRTTVITTGINSTIDRPAITTLFQATTDSANDVLWVDGKPHKDFPLEQKLTGTTPEWLLDTKNTGYYIHAGGASVVVARRSQQWTYMIDKYLLDPKDNPVISYIKGQYRFPDMKENEKFFKVSSGDYATAWFEHGNKPSDAAAAYTLVVQTTPDKMKALAAKLPYKILEQDNQVHAVFDFPSNTAGYVIFSANPDIAAAGVLRSIDQPGFVMVQQEGSNLNISLASPDHQRTQPIGLTVQGAWKIKSKDAGTLSVTQTGKTTWIEAQPDGFTPMHFALEAAP